MCPEQRGLPGVWAPWRADPSVPRSLVPGSPVRLCPSAPSLCPRARGACPPGPSSPGTRPPGPPHTRVVLPWAVACPPLTPRAARWEGPRWPFPGSAPAPCIWQSPGLLGQLGSDFWGGFFGLSITENWLTTAGSGGWDVVRAPRRELERGVTKHCPPEPAPGCPRAWLWGRQEPGLVPRWGSPLKEPRPLEPETKARSATGTAGRLPNRRPQVAGFRSSPEGGFPPLSCTSVSATPPPWGPLCLGERLERPSCLAPPFEWEVAVRRGSRGTPAPGTGADEAPRALGPTSLPPAGAAHPATSQFGPPAHPGSFLPTAHLTGGCPPRCLADLGAGGRR